MTDMDLVTLSSTCRRVVRKNPDEAVVYAAFMLIFYFATKFCSDGKFSALITAGAAFQCLGFALLHLQLRKGAAGISLRSLQLFAIAYIFRLFSTLQYNGYLPIDRTGDWVYQAIDVVALALVFSMILRIGTTCSSSYEGETDTCVVVPFVLGCILLSAFVHPSLNNTKAPDMAWTCALYLEAFAMVPQLYMLTKKGGEVESLSTHYIACVFVARVLMICFWSRTYHELQPKSANFNLPGYGVMSMQLLQVVIFADFMLYYAKSIATRKKLVLPVAI